MARPDSPYTRDFEDVVAWLAQQMAKTPIAGLLRIAWDSVGKVVQRVMADHLDERRLVGLVAIGVDEISYRRGQRYLTCVADHATGVIVWCAPGRNSATLQAFFDELGERRHSIRAVSIDMSGEYQRAIRAGIPQAEICFDPFHVCRLASRATDQSAPPHRRTGHVSCGTRDGRTLSRSRARATYLLVEADRRLAGAGPDARVSSAAGVYSSAHDALAPRAKAAAVRCVLRGTPSAQPHG